MNLFVRLCKGLNDKGILIPYKSDYFDYIDDPNKDYYLGAFYYNEDQFEFFKKNGSIKGIQDVVTDRLVFDFDCKDNVQEAKHEVEELLLDLNKHRISKQDIEIYYSGNKGFHVILTLNRFITPKEAQNISYRFTKTDKTIDRSLYDAPQLIRIAGTKHQETGLYKIPLTFNQLFDLNVEQIKELAKTTKQFDLNFNWQVINPDEDFYKSQEITISKKKEIVSINNTVLDYTNKPKFLSNCRWSLQNGFFKEGERSNSFLCLAATYKNLGFELEHTYRLLKGVAEIQSNRNTVDRFPDEELYNNIISQVYSDTWRNGQFSCKEVGTWLSKYCTALGNHSCTEEVDNGCLKINDLNSKFSKFVNEFDKNIIKTGITGLDNNAMFLNGTFNGILGSPGAGKTAMSLNFLKNASQNNIHSIFLSMDMGLPLVYGKLIQKIKKVPFKEALHLFQTNEKVQKEVIKQINEDYKNTFFNFKSGLTIDNIKDIVKEQENTSGEKIRLMVIDYLECMTSSSSDNLANTGFICNQLKDLANELETCIVMLLQTQKHSTADISDPLTSMRQIKGSSTIEQSMSVITTMWREGYNPKYIDMDKFVSFAVVKNRFGQLWSDDFKWEGVTGNIMDLSEYDRTELKELRTMKADLKAQNNKAWS